MFTKPATAPQPVITTTEAADWLNIDDTDTLLPGMILTATSLVIEYLQLELISRSRTAIYETWPNSGTDTSPSLSPNNIEWDATIPLPYTNLISIESVKVFGTTTSEYQIKRSKPAEIRFNMPFVMTSSYPAIEVEYTAGFGDIDDVPEVIKTGVKMLCAYLYEHRGDCDMGNAIDKSGASIMLQPYKAFAVMV